ncbi:unnamed protein product [Caenorhabditis angaria]|uniref:Uncharacterized protein n=1 Tax=Caenorhabditis angaria TaxID=860376 RepID=A0A9P1I6G0_9PELO|nr:unnamed protein product [Caenorhabditis angaria]
MSGRSVQTTISTQQITDKCAIWIERTCAITHQLVAEVCEYFDNLDQVTELLQAITNSLKNEWPRIGPNKIVYEKLLQDVVVNKSRKLLVEWIVSVENSARKQFESTNDGPSTSLFDERTYRADSQAHIGISTQLFKCVKSLWESLESINEKCHQFENICTQMSDSNTSSVLKTTLATNVHQVLLRLCEIKNHEKSNDECSSVKSRECLLKARLALALVHSDSSLVCHLMDKDSQQITSLNKRLHSIIENNLRYFLID